MMLPASAGSPSLLNSQVNSECRETPQHALRTDSRDGAISQLQKVGAKLISLKYFNKRDPIDRCIEGVATLFSPLT